MIVNFLQIYHIVFALILLQKLQQFHLFIRCERVIWMTDGSANREQLFILTAFKYLLFFTILIFNFDLLLLTDHQLSMFVLNQIICFIIIVIYVYFSI